MTSRYRSIRPTIKQILESSFFHKKVDKTQQEKWEESSGSECFLSFLLEKY